MKAIDTVMQLEEMHGTIPGIDVVSCSHQEALNLKVVAYKQAKITWDKAIKEVVSKLEGWQKLGTHLVSDEAIQELRNLGG